MAGSDQDMFYGFNTEMPRTFITGFVFGDIDPMDPYAIVSPTNTVPDMTLLVDLSATGSLSGTVSDNAGPVADADVVIVGGNLSAKTDESGKYSFPHLMAGTYKVQVSKFGYLTSVNEFNITASETTAGDISLPLIVGYPVSGKVTDAASGEGIGDVTLVLKGYENYRAVSDSEGNYVFPDVYGGEYEIIAVAGGYKYYSSTIEVSESTVNDIALTEIPYSVASVDVALDASNVTISWEKPEAVDCFRYDSGLVSSETGFGNGSMYGVFGAAHRESATLTGMSWYLTSRGGLQDKVNLFVFALGDDGNPTSQLLYSAMDVPSGIDGWSDYTFPEPVEAPNGFYVALGRNSGFLSVGVTLPSEKYPFTPHTQFYSGDYRSGTFIAVEDPAMDGSAGQSVNYMIRAKGISNGRIVYYGPSKTLSSRDPQPENYRVYRLIDGSAEDAWTEIGNTTDLSYSDSWEPLADGKIYRYAVVAEYASGNSSEPVLSPSLPKGMEVPYMVKLATNCGDSPEGAVLTLVNQDNDLSHVYTMTALGADVEFPSVWRGVYDLTITKTGFNPVAVDDIVIDGPGLSYCATLIETIEDPFNLEVEVADGGATLTWNNAPESFFDDMEAHEDFTISGIGQYTLYDGDRQPTYWFNDIYFDNMGYVGSYIVMNPSHTVPAANSKPFLPYSGNKYLACFATSSPMSNNDWLILPKLRINDGSVLRFMAQNFTLGFDIARFKVGVSVSGTAPEDFEIISDGDYVEAPYANQGLTASWEQLEYDLSDYAGHEAYVAIACVSDDSTSALMIDDLEVIAGSDTPVTDKLPELSGNRSYTVYLDGSVMASDVNDRYFRFSELEAGQHTAGVQAVYRSGVSAVVTLDFNVTDTGKIELTVEDRITAYIDHAGILHITAQNDIIRVAGYDMNGRVAAMCQDGGKEMDLSSLPAGCYIVSVTSVNGTHTLRMVKH